MSSPLRSTTNQNLADLVSSHVLGCFQAHRAKTLLPLFVGLQGPQGSGKTTVTRAVHTKLSNHQSSPSVVVLSLDDLYLPHDGLAEVAKLHPSNGLLCGRGQPGTHDVVLGEQLLRQLQSLGAATDSSTVELPCFDKSLHGGEGDRLPPGSGTIVKAPVDIVIVEGWCMGFYPVETTQLEKMYSRMSSLSDSAKDSPPDMQAIFASYSLEDIIQVSEYLRTYGEKLYPFFTAFVQITPPLDSPYSVVYRWRLQQEHQMKSLNGGKGMTDAQVKSFIDRYMPGYFFFQEGIELGYNTAEDVDPDRFPPWKGRHLRVTIDEERVLTAVEHC